MKDHGALMRSSARQIARSLEDVHGYPAAWMKAEQVAARERIHQSPSREFWSKVATYLRFRAHRRKP